MKINKFRSYHY